MVAGASVKVAIGGEPTVHLDEEARRESPGPASTRPDRVEVPYDPGYFGFRH
jgi:hypothetical protein